MMTSFQALAWVSWSLAWMVNADLRPHVLELHPLLDEFRWIDLDAYGRRLLAADAHKGDARDLTEVLGEDVFGGVVDVDHRRDVRLNG